MAELNRLIRTSVLESEQVVRVIFVRRATSPFIPSDENSTLNVEARIWILATAFKVTIWEFHDIDTLWLRNYHVAFGSSVAYSLF